MKFHSRPKKMAATKRASKRRRMNRNEPKAEENEEELPRVEVTAENSTKTEEISEEKEKKEKTPVIVFAHGAGAPSSSDWMIRWKDMLSKALNAIEVVTFDYPYISGGKKRAPPKAEKLVEFHCDIVRKTMAKYPCHPLVLAGKSMGSRVSCMVSGEKDIAASAIVCLGYPLKGMNGAVRDETLLKLTVPVMFVQGSKDGLCPLSKLENVRKKMNSNNELQVIEGGDHSFKIAKKHLLQSTGTNQEEAEAQAVEAIATFVSSSLKEKQHLGRDTFGLLRIFPSATTTTTTTTLNMNVMHNFDCKNLSKDMKITNYAGLAKPSCLLVHCEVPAFTFHRRQLLSISSPCISSPREKRCGLVMKLHSASGRTCSSTAVDLSLSKEEKFNRERKEVNPSSFYSHPSLLQMKNERIANRARVYEFLRGIGIVPDELDGLELPVTVEVMRERVDFLHSLGLTIEDINNYPLVLGCSVKKNMVPVLDYLGKLGVRNSTFTEFLRRYPQVLHASVVVDLAPVVKYLQGMDIKPNDIPRVLEKYPEVLGFKLEGTMSTSVAYLVGIGVARREIGGVLTRYPEILGMRVGRVIKPFVEYLGSLGIPSLAVARLIEKRPHILGFGLDERVKRNVNLLLEYNVRQTSLAAVIAQYPEIIGIDLDTKLLSQRDFLISIVELGHEDFGRVIEKMPQIVSLSDKAIVRHVNFLKECGFSLEQVKKMVVGCPQLLALNVDIMKLSFDYFKSSMDERPLDDLVTFPAYFTYSLESTIKPRNKKIIRKGVKCSLAWLLNCSNDKFEDRMSYDSIGVEELEVEESSFDMNTLMKPSSEEFDSEYEDDDSDDE
ncbi:hypothetical protein ACJIZ3_001894 [Penstemon smallii]|uniref:Transcription termination factor MTERF4, chloroplastic n=1 Tax=Penstemon smallii TaxID=265156 RepID=A0ABD3U4Y3_9LAMI